MREEKLNKKRKLLLSLTLTFFIAGILLIVWLLFFNNRSYNQKYKTNYFSLRYDNTWKVLKKENNYLLLTHSTNSLIDVKASKLSTEYINTNIENMVDEIKYDIEKSHSNYVILKEESTTITEEKYSSYKLLYENDNEQTLVVLIKNNKYLLTISYTSKNEYFDILLDSFQTVLGSIKFN